MVKLVCVNGPAAQAGQHIIGLQLCVRRLS